MLTGRAVSNLRRISKTLGALAMGGKGSGRHNGAKRGRVEAHLALHVGDLQRGGVRRPGAFGTLTWGMPARPLGAVRFRATESELELSYCVGDGATESIVERISLARVGAGFGGVRTYFYCPACARRIEHLYFASARFRCQTCHGLAYASQCEDVERRAARRANKARARLGYPAWRLCELVPVARPKGKWSRKSSALQTRVYEVDCRATTAWLDRVGPVIERVEGRFRAWEI